MKPKSGYRPINSLNNGPFASRSSPRQSSLVNGDIQSRKESPYFTQTEPKEKTPGYTSSFHEEEPARKRRRVADSRETDMSREEPIVIEDDMEVDERDELAFSSDEDQVKSAPTKKHLFTRPSKAVNKLKPTNIPRIEEYHNVEDMMSSSKYHISPARKPLQVLHSNDSHEDDHLSKTSTDEELFTKKSKQQRLGANEKDSPEAVLEPTGIARVTEALKPDVKSDLKGVFHSSSFMSAHSEVESPDAIQVVVEHSRKPSGSRNMPLHEGSNQNLADAIIHGVERPVPSKAGDRRLTKPFRPKAEDRKAKDSDKRDFFLRRLRYGSLPTDYSYKITIRENDSMLAIYPQSEPLLSDGDDFDSFPLGRVLKIFQGENDCTKVMLSMSRTQDALDDKMHLEFVSEKEVYDFVRLVQTLAGGRPDILSKPRQVLPKYLTPFHPLTWCSAWMNSAFEKYQQPLSTQRDRVEPYLSRPTVKLERPAAAISDYAPDSIISKGPRNQIKRTDLLQPSRLLPLKPNGSTLGARTVITGDERRAIAQARPLSPTYESPAKHPPTSTEGLVSKFFPPRATRSSAVSSVALNRFDRNTSMPKVKFSQTGELGTPWKKPLIYPKTGKKRETVDFQDLERLDDDEFLNDNLIGFYLRYLEHYLEKEKPDTAKKVYFFNSYFFERLTQTQKGTKGINYAAVQKWTRTVDIFSRDFVVVPVNENLHWYVAIICNLPNLRRKLADDEDEEDEVESIDTSETIPAANGNGNGNGEMTQEQVEEPDGEIRSSFAEFSLADKGKGAPANEEIPAIISAVKPQSSPKSKKGPGRRKSARRSLPKIDPKKPVVITLDSLGLTRTATRTALKDYIVEEGKAKRSLDLDRGALDGVTAKGIPTQKNYSDCGLFLCAYMERFVLDPYQFVHDILQRDMDEGKDWPMMSSHELRSRLRSVIMELHRQQEGEKEMVPIPDVGRTLLRRPLSPSPQLESEPDLQELHNAAADLADEEAASQVNGELIAAASVTAQAPSSPELSQGAALKSAEDAVNHPSPEKPRASTRGTAQATIVISDDSPNSSGPRHMSARFRSRANINDDFLDEPKELADNPQAWADKIRRERSPAAPQGRGRPVSVSTDFMESLESYARQPIPDEMPGACADGEVPETQPQDLVKIGGAAEVDPFPDEIIAGL